MRCGLYGNFRGSGFSHRCRAFLNCLMIGLDARYFEDYNCFCCVCKSHELLVYSIRLEGLVLMSGWWITAEIHYFGYGIEGTLLQGFKHPRILGDKGRHRS